MTEEPDADPVIVRALLEMATVWRCWCLVKHSDGRIMAGRAGDIRIFGGVMLRLDVPDAEPPAIHMFNVAAIEDVLVCREQEARDALAAMEQPESLQTLLAHLAAGRPTGGADGRR